MKKMLVILVMPLLFIVCANNKEISQSVKDKMMETFRVQVTNADVEFSDFEIEKQDTDQSPEDKVIEDYEKAIHAMKNGLEYEVHVPFSPNDTTIEQKIAFAEGVKDTYIELKQERDRLYNVKPIYTMVVKITKSGETVKAYFNGNLEWIEFEMLN